MFENNVLNNDYNNALDDFAQALKRLLKEKKEKGETLTSKDIDTVRRSLRFI